MLPTITVSDLIVALYDAKTGALLTYLDRNDEIPVDLIEGRDITATVAFRDNLEEEVGSVRLSMAGDTRVENVAPYALFGDANGDFFRGESYDAGSYNIGIQVYSGGNGTGTQMLSTNFGFSVVEESTPVVAQSSASFDDIVISLVNTATDDTVAELSDGYAVDKSDVSGSKMTLVVEAADDDFAEQIGSVRLTYGDIVRVENTAPYSMFGDIGTDNFIGGKYLSEGEHDVKIEVFSLPGANGALLASESLTFTVEDDVAAQPSTPSVPVAEPVVAVPDPVPEPVIAPSTPTTEPSITVSLVNTTTDKVITEISDNDEIEASGNKYSFVVEGDGDFADEIGSVRLTYGNIVRVENAAPYALFGDQDGDYWGGTSLGTGDKTVKVEVFAGSNATGARLLTETVDFSVETPTVSAPVVEPEPEPTPVEPDPEPVAPSVPSTPSTPTPTVSGDTFIGENGTIILEAESGDSEGAWKQTFVDGETVMLWDNNTNHYSGPQDGQSLTFTILADESGSYNIGLHSGRVKSAMSASDAARTDTGNDAYVRVTEVDTGKVVLSPTKLFTGLGGGDRVLKWGSTFDQNHVKSPATVTLEAGTEYQFELVGRSDGYMVDRITLNKGGVLANENLPESETGGGSSSPSEPAAPEPVTNPSGSTQAVGTDAEFNGIRLWVAQDISEIDDAASVATLMLGAKNLSESNDNITGSASTLTLEGAYIDTDYNISRSHIDDVQSITETASSLYGIDLYSPFDGTSSANASLFDGIGEGEAAWKSAFTQSMNQAYANGEQLLVISGGPSIASYEVALEWLNSASGADQVEKAIWMLEGGFSQVTHGDDYTNDGELDYSRDPNSVFFNIQTKTNTNVNESFEQLYDRALSIAENGVGTYYTQTEFNQIDNDFVDNSLLISVENQNLNNTVRGDIDTISQYIDNGFALQQAQTYSKDNGNTIDISDVGMLGILKDDGAPLSLSDLEDITQDDFLVA